MAKRLQFRLRTLLIVVTLLAGACGYVGHEANTVNQRRSWLANHPQVMMDVIAIHKWVVPRPKIGPIRRWLGDDSFSMIVVDDPKPGEVETARSLFPEADVIEMSFRRP